MTRRMSRLVQDKDFNLRPWAEIVGQFTGLLTEGGYVYCQIGGKTLAFPTDSAIAKYLRERLDDDFIGRTIGILRTDLADQPILVRLVDDRMSKVGWNPCP